MPEHLPRFPQYRYHAHRCATLAYLVPEAGGGYQILTERQEVYPLGCDGDSWDHARSVVAGMGLDCFCGGFTATPGAFPWAYRAATDPSATVHINREGYVTGIRVRMGRSTGQFISAAPWGVRASTIPAALSFLAHLRRFYRQVASGDHPTPASLGTASLHQFMSREHGRSGLPSVTTPNRVLQAHILSANLGGRSEVPSLGDVAPVGWEYDLIAAYPTAARGLPMGTAMYAKGENVTHGSEYFACATFTLDSDLYCSPVSIHPATGARAPHLWDLPAGSYAMWLWRQEVAALRRRGVTVAITAAWYWQSTTQALAPWIDAWLARRDVLARRGQKREAGWIKGMVNATIGVWGQHPTAQEVITADAADWEADQPVQPDLWMVNQSREWQAWGPPPDLWVHSTPDWRRTTLSHWFSYVVMRVRMALYDRMVRDRVWAPRHRLLSTNFDGLLLTLPSMEPLHVVWDGQEWQWKEKRHTEVRIPYRRALVSAQAITLPGIPLVEQSAYVSALKGA